MVDYWHIISSVKPGAWCLPSNYSHHMAETEDNSESDKKVFLSIEHTPIYFREDWDTGIGGGLWSTGLALAKYFEHHSSDVSENLKRLDELKRKRGDNDGISAIELGSGNGCLSACLLALAQQKNIPLKHLAVTDLDDHLSLMDKTIRSNPHTWDELIVSKGGSSSTHSGSPSNKKEQRPVSVTVKEYAWGVDVDEKYDFIFGSDLAYRDYLHDPLISSLLQLSHQHTICLIGVTMNDTRPIFFKKLTQNGFRYERLADHNLEGQFRGGNFGIFVIMRR